MKICEHFDICGGCTKQQIPYALQIAEKEKFVHNLFAPYTDFFFPIIACSSVWQYRKKMEFSFAENKAGERYLGLRGGKGRGGTVFNLRECHLCPLWMVDAKEIAYEWWQTSDLHAYFPPANVGSLRTLTLRQGIENQRMVNLTLSGHEKFLVPLFELERFAKMMTSRLQLSSIIATTQMVKKKEPTRFEERVLYGQDHLIDVLVDGKRQYQFKIRPSAFFQPNQFTASCLYVRAMEMAAFDPKESVLDLYCGTGTFSIFAAAYVESVMGIELNAEAVKDAKENCMRNGCHNVEFMQADIAKLDFKILLKRTQTLILDPPRSGLAPKALEKVIEIGAKKIIYISCNPMTQHENFLALQEAGYRIAGVQPIDQFPHTDHIENILLLIKV